MEIMKPAMMKAQLLSLPPTTLMTQPQIIDGTPISPFYYYDFYLM